MKFLTQRNILPEKTTDISRRQNWFPRKMKSEEIVQKFHTDDVLLPRYE